MGNNQYIPLAEVDQRIAEIEEALAKLPIELEMLKQLRSGAVLLDLPRREVRASADSSPKTKIPARTTDAIIQYLRMNPRVTPPVVAGALENRIRSKAGNKRRTLLSTIYNMTRAGRLESDERGRLTVARNENGGDDRG